MTPSVRYFIQLEDRRRTQIHLGAGILYRPAEGERSLSPAQLTVLTALDAHRGLLVSKAYFQDECYLASPATVVYILRKILEEGPPWRHLISHQRGLGYRLANYHRVIYPPDTLAPPDEGAAERAPIEPLLLPPGLFSAAVSLSHSLEQDAG